MKCGVLIILTSVFLYDVHQELVFACIFDGDESAAHGVAVSLCLQPRGSHVAQLVARAMESDEAVRTSKLMLNIRTIWGKAKEDGKAISRALIIYTLYY